MQEHYLYHGATGAEILSILDSHTVIPNDQGRIYFARFSWENVLQHGADRDLGASFAIQVRAEIPDVVLQDSQRVETHGVPDTLILPTRQPIRVSVLHLYVRERAADPEEGFELHHFSGEQQIREEIERRQRAPVR